MKRHFVDFAAMVSLALAVASAILWSRSYWRADVIAFRSVETADGGMNRRSRTVFSSGGLLFAGTSTTRFIPVSPVRPGEPTFVVNRSPQPQGWVRRVYPAPWAYPLPQPQFQTLGLRGALQPEREMDGSNYRMPGVKVRTSSMFLAMPHWMVVLIGLTAPTWWLVRRRKLLRLERLSQGLCVGCGYDLRGSAAGGRCPECGAVAAVPSTAA